MDKKFEGLIVQDLLNSDSLVVRKDIIKNSKIIRIIQFALLSGKNILVVITK